MRTWFCLSLIKRNNYRNSSSSQLLASCSNESLESTSINETTADLSATAILFSFLNLARDSADALHSFAPAVMVTDLMNLSSVPLMHRDLCDLESQILIQILPKERTLSSDGKVLITTRHRTSLLFRRRSYLVSLLTVRQD